MCRVCEKRIRISLDRDKLTDDPARANGHGGLSAETLWDAVSRSLEAASRTEPHRPYKFTRAGGTRLRRSRKTMRALDDPRARGSCDTGPSCSNWPLERGQKAQGSRKNSGMGTLEDPASFFLSIAGCDLDTAEIRGRCSTPRKIVDWMGFWEVRGRGGFCCSGQS